MGWLVRITRARVGLVLLLAYAAVSDARWAYRAATGVLEAGREDPISRYERRFRGLRSLLPSRGAVGYMSGVRPEAFTSEDFRRFVLTEYALAPLLVVDDTTPELLVGNFAPDSVPADPPAGFHVIRSLEPGVWLLRRAR